MPPGPCILVVMAAFAAAPDETLRAPVTRDVWLSNVGPEVDGNNGGAPTLKAKSYQELAIVDLDPAPLRGRVVTVATLHVRSSGNEPLRRVTVGSVAAPWVEGTGRSYEPQKGSSTFRNARHPDVPWTLDGGDFCRVMLGEGNTLWRMADASPPDADRWQTIAVDPAVVAARVAGISEGFVVFDDTGSEWTRDGEKFTARHMPNRFYFSKDSNRASAPYFTVSVGARDDKPPAAPGEIRSAADDLPAGEARVWWPTPQDVGPAGVIGFRVKVDGKAVPQYLVPRPGRSGEPATTHLRDLGLEPGKAVAVEVQAVDGAGNIGPAARATVKMSGRKPTPLPGASPPPIAADPAPLPKLGQAEVAVVDELDKVNPVDGTMIPAQADGYRSRNHLWSARDQRVTLHAARNEFVAFQVVLGREVKDLRASLAFKGGASKVGVDVGRYVHVGTKKGPLPDPIVAFRGKEDRADEAPGAKSQSLHIELYVPRETPAGTHESKLTLRGSGGSLDIAVSLVVWDVALPDVLGFLPEMNCYGLPKNERAYYRLAHRHRTVLNRLPYSQRGTIEDGCAPTWDGKTLDFAAWDRRFGPLFDGSAFADLPRKGVSIEVFYLPLHENWPTPIDPNYNGSYWADHAFTPEYRAAFVAASRQFAEHVKGKKWNGTLFQGFLNNKVDFKRNGWSRASSPWLLDEPSGFQDFWALRYYATAFHEGVRQGTNGDPSRLAFRADISRPQWQRDSLDGLLDYNVVGSAVRPYHRIAMDRKARDGQVVVEYGSANPIDESNMQAVGWSLDAWCLGLDGVLPWQTIGRRESWTQADTLALFYPSRDGGDPTPSIRLKAFRRGQQDVELLRMLAAAMKEPRWALGATVREALGLAGQRGASGTAGAAEDAGLVRYNRLRPQDAWALRVRVAKVLSEKHASAPAAAPFATPPRDPSRLEPREVERR